MNPIIEAKNIYKCYPGFPPVLRGINIKVMPGEMVAIMGPSGCGKSTMLHILGMLHAPDSGHLNILGTDIMTLSRDETSSFRRGNMGFVMQSSNLFDFSTVFENVEFPLIFEQVPPEERWERVIRALELVRLSHRVSYRSNRLSGGEQQRVAVARAMVNNPRILLADEPTGALDSRTSKVVMENFRTLAHEGGIAMVIVTHDPSVAEYCDSIYSLEEGVLICKKQTTVTITKVNSQLLESNPRILNAACVVDEFPTKYGTTDTQHILNIYDQKLLSRVYSMRGAKFTSIGDGEYSLPVIIKKQGSIRAFLNIFSLLRVNHGNPGIVWKYWSQIPRRQRFNIFAAIRHLWHMAKSISMVRWSLAEDTSHLHAVGSESAATAAWMASGILGIPFSFSFQAKHLHNIRLAAIKAKYASFVCCDSKQTQKELIQACLNNEANFPVNKIIHSYETPSIGAAIDGDVLPASGAVHGQINIVMAGHITETKGILTAMKACAALKKDKIPLHLTIIGDGPFLRKLRLNARLMGLRKNITFTKYITHDQMGEHYNKANIFIAANTSSKQSHESSIATSLTEAMLFALPIVASDLKAHKEILEDEQTALIFQQNSVESLTKALNKLITRPDEAKMMGKKAQEAAQKLFLPEIQGLQLSKAILKHHSISKNNAQI